jgi:glycosyltransferase involved in cell wall biosynthesis
MTDEMKTASGRHDAHIIPFGANTSIFKPYPQHRARDDLGLPKNKKFILFPWNPARPEKKHSLALRVVEYLQQFYDIKLITVFNQPRETIAKYMNACDAMILTSSHEGSPLAVREALACNLPVVSVDVGDVRTVVEITNGGFIAKNEVRDIAEKISLVLDSEQTIFNNLSEAYDAKFAAKKVLDLYSQILT